MELILDRVLDRDDLVLFVADLIQSRIEGGRFARAGRPGHQHHAVRLSDIAAKLAQVFFSKANDIQIQVAELFVDLLFVENTNNRILAVNGGHDRDAEVYVTALVANSETTVLRHAPLSDI